MAPTRPRTQARTQAPTVEALPTTTHLELGDVDLQALMAMVAQAELPRRKARRKAASTTTAVAYLRESTAEQAESGLGRAAQRAAIEGEAARRGVRVVGWYTDEGVSGSVHPEARPQLAAALATLGRGGAGGAGCLLVARVDRLSRSLGDLLALLTQAERGGWVVVSADGLLDTASLQGRIMALVLGVVAEIEREFIKSRTREALAAKKMKGERVGRPVTTPDAVRYRIAELRAGGMTLAAVAETMNAEGTATVQGKQWSAGNVDRVIRSLRLDAELALAANA